MKRSVKSSRPTGGDCYRVAHELALSVATLTDEVRYLPSTVRLCHGFPTGQGPIKGIVHGHAWVEIQDYFKGEWWVIDRSNKKNILMPRETYYAIGKIEPATVDKYTKEDALRMLLAYRHCGPWED